VTGLLAAKNHMRPSERLRNFLDITEPDANTGPTHLRRHTDIPFFKLTRDFIRFYFFSAAAGDPGSLMQDERG